MGVGLKEESIKLMRLGREPLEPINLEWYLAVCF